MNRLLSTAIQTRLQRQLDRWQLFAPCAGVNVTLLDSGQGSWTGAAGYAEVDERIPMPAAAPCYIYSIGKTLTAIRVLQLVELGLVELDWSISHYLSEVALPEQVTIRRLLNHSSGVPSYTDLPDYLPANLARPDVPWSYETVLGKTCTGTLDFEPGHGWHYSNTGYMLLKRLIETVSAQSYAANIERHIIEPLQLEQTRVTTCIDDGRLTPGYCACLNDQQTMEDIRLRYHPDWCLTGLLVSTTDDIARLYHALFHTNLLSDASLRAMTDAVSIGSVPHPCFVQPAYGLGLMADKQFPDGSLYGHGGDGPGFNTWAMHLPAWQGRAMTVVIFCNTSMGSHPFMLAKKLLNIVKMAD